MNEYGMHIVINYFYHMICHSNVMKTTKKNNTGISLRLSAHQASNVIKSGRMWEFHHQTGGDRTDLPAHRPQHKLIHKKKTTHRKQNMLYLADMSSRLTCSNYFLNLTVVSFLSIKLKKK